MSDAKGRVMGALADEMCSGAVRFGSIQVSTSDAAELIRTISDQAKTIRELTSGQWKPDRAQIADILCSKLVAETSVDSVMRRHTWVTTDSIYEAVEAIIALGETA